MNKPFYALVFKIKYLFVVYEFMCNMWGWVPIEGKGQCTSGTGITGSYGLCDAGVLGTTPRFSGRIIKQC